MRTKGNRISIAYGCGPVSPGCAATPALSPEDKHRVAIHEASHAVVMRALGTRLSGVTIVPANDFLGAAWGRGADPKRFSSQQSVEDRAQASASASAITPPIGIDRSEGGFGGWLCYALGEMIALVAGREGERLAGCESPACSAHDEAKARSLALSLVYANAASDALIGYARAEARSLLEAYWPAVEAVAQALLERHTIGGDETDLAIATALAQHELRREAERRAAWSHTLANAALFKSERR